MPRLAHKLRNISACSIAAGRAPTNPTDAAVRDEIDAAVEMIRVAAGRAKKRSHRKSACYGAFFPDELEGGGKISEFELGHCLRPEPALMFGS